MKSKLLNDNNGTKTYAVIFDENEEALSGLTDFAVQKNLTAVHFTAIGAFKKVKLGYFNIERKDYKENIIDEQVEVLSLAGNITLHKGKPKVHGHIVVGKEDGTAYGGHLLEGIVRPTLEVVLVETPAYLKREFNEKFQLALIDV